MSINLNHTGSQNITLTNDGVADKLLVNGFTVWHSGNSPGVGDASTLDTLDSTQFLRSDTSDNFTSGTLTFDSGTTTTFAAGSTVNFNRVTGVSPFTVASTTVVTNLNADSLDGQDGSYYTNASNLGTGTLPAGRLPAFSGGDVTSSAGSAVLTLASILSVASYGSSTQVGTFTTDAKGRITAASNTTIQVTDLYFSTTSKATGVTDGIRLNDDDIYRDVNNATIVMSGGNASGAGGLMVLYGGTHATLANQAAIRGSTVTILNQAGTETQATFVADGAVTLYHNNSAKLATDSAGATTTGTHTATDFNATSAQRFKTDIKKLEEQIVNVRETIDSLYPVSYNWKEDFIGYVKGKQFGFIAEEIELTDLRTLVKHTENGETQGLNYNGFHAISILAIQDIYKTLATINAKLDDLNKRIGD